MARPRLAAAALALSLLAPTLAAQDFDPRPVEPLRGSLVLAGEGKLHDAAIDVFVHLAGGYDADLVIVASSGRPRSLGRWSKSRARTATAVGDALPDARELSLLMLEADGVWFEDDAGAVRDDPLFTALLHDVLARGGVVGGQGEGALVLCEGDEGGDGARTGLGLLPRSRVELVSKAGRSKRKGDAPAGDGRVDWLLPKETALVVGYGRKVGAVGEADVHVRIPGTDVWPERRATVSPQDVFELTDFVPYDLDLVAWLRSAQDRQGPSFPPESPAKPVVPKGTLVLSGGGGVQSETWRRFIDAAGGKQATYVCFPSGSDYFTGEEPKSYGAGQLRDHGCHDVHVVDPASAARADEDPELLALLEEATGVWIDGGRTYRVMDALQYTRAHELIREVLEGGGAVGGSSAGCQVLGELLVRGDPRSNQTLLFDGYTSGLGLLPGVVLDAHFLQRERHPEFAELVQQHPQLLGIGVDEDTALVVEKSIAEVLGQAAVSFYDASGSDGAPVILEAGQRYDLVERRAAR